MTNKINVAGELLKVAKLLVSSGISVGKTVETKAIRIHRYRTSYMVWDLENAGKRGKKVETFQVYNIDRLESDEAINIIEELGSKLLKAKSYKEALSIAKETIEKINELGEKTVSMSERTERGVDVTPAGFEPYEIRGKHVYIKSDYKDFTVRDLDDHYNEETCIPAISGGKKSVKLMYRWVSDNENKIKNMSFNQIVNEMQKNNIKYHRYCAMD